MEIIFGAFSNKLKMGRSTDIEIIFLKLLELFLKKNWRWAGHPILRQYSVKKREFFCFQKNLMMRRSLDTETIFRKIHGVSV